MMDSLVAKIALFNLGILALKINKVNLYVLKFQIILQTKIMERSVLKIGIKSSSA